MRITSALVIGFAIIGCSNHEMTTELDKALQAAQSDQSHSDAYYNLFLNSDLFIPTRNPEAPTGTESRRTSEGETFIPVVVEHNGIPFLPVFDNLERLQAWAQGHEMTYVLMSAHALIRSSLDPNLHLALNVGTPHFKEFLPDELAWLRQVADQRTPSAFTVPAGTEVFVGVPERLPRGLEDALSTCLRRNHEVEAAYRGQVQFDLPGEQPQLFLVLKISDTGKDYVQNINEDIGIAIQGLLGKEDSLTLQIYDGKGISSDVVTRVNPFYSRQK